MADDETAIVEYQELVRALSLPKTTRVYRPVVKKIFPESLELTRPTHQMDNKVVIDLNAFQKDTMKQAFSPVEVVVVIEKAKAGGRPSLEYVSFVNKMTKNLLLHLRGNDWLRLCPFDSLKIQKLENKLALRIARQAKCYKYKAIGNPKSILITF